MALLVSPFFACSLSLSHCCCIGGLSRTQNGEGERAHGSNEPRPRRLVTRQNGELAAAGAVVVRLEVRARCSFIAASLVASSFACAHYFIC